MIEMDVQHTCRQGSDWRTQKELTDDELVVKLLRQAVIEICQLLEKKRQKVVRQDFQETIRNIRQRVKSGKRKELMTIRKELYQQQLSDHAYSIKKFNLEIAIKLQSYQDEYYQRQSNDKVFQIVKSELDKQLQLLGSEVAVVPVQTVSTLETCPTSLKKQSHLTGRNETNVKTSDAIRSQCLQVVQMGSQQGKSIRHNLHTRNLSERTKEISREVNSLFNEAKLLNTQANKLAQWVKQKQL